MWNLIKVLFWVTLGVTAAAVFVPGFLDELPQAFKEIVDDPQTVRGEGPEYRSAQRPGGSGADLDGDTEPYAGPRQGLDRPRQERLDSQVQAKLNLLRRNPERFKIEMDRAYQNYSRAEQARYYQEADEWYEEYALYADALEYERRQRSRR